MRAAVAGGGSIMAAQQHWRRQTTANSGRDGVPRSRRTAGMAASLARAAHRLFSGASGAAAPRVFAVAWRQAEHTAGAGETVTRLCGDG